MPSPIIDNHPRRDAIEAALRSGRAPATVAEEFDVSYETLRSWWRRTRQAQPTIEVEGNVDDLDAELDRALAIATRARERGLEVSSIAVQTADREGSWDGWTRDAADEPAVSGRQSSERTERKARVAVRIPKAEEAEAGPVIRQAEPIDVTFTVPRRLPAREETSAKWAVIMPDAQRPFVDHAAVDVALQILADVQAAHGVDHIVHLGDELDLPDFGRHRSAPEALGRVQDAIDEQYRVLATERAMCPEARMSWIAGNHDDRLVNWLVDNAPQLIGLRRAGERTTPALSVEYLCRLAELGVEYVGPFPEGEVWLNGHLRAVHGDIMKSQKGQTAAAYLAGGQVSTIYGHIHRAELVYQTRHTAKGPRTYLAGSPGCLCRIDGAVPSAKSGITSAGGPGMRRTEDWQQGIWVVSYETTGRQLYAVEPIHIWGGRATWRGRDYAARVDVDGVALEGAA